jgi:CRP-like cAMP-binding protein
MDPECCYLFKGLGAEKQSPIKSLVAEIPMRRDERIFTEGEEAATLYVIKEGAAELMTRDDEGFELPIAILRKAGDCFGVAALLPPRPYSLSARCVKEGALWTLPREALLEMMRADFELGCMMMTNLAGHFLDRLKESRQELRVHFRTLLRSTHT